MGLGAGHYRGVQQSDITYSSESTGWSRWGGCIFIRSCLVQDICLLGRYITLIVHVPVAMTMVTYNHYYVATLLAFIIFGPP